MFDAYEAHIDGMHAFLLKEKIPIFLILLSNVENASFTRLIDSLQFGNKAHSTFIFSLSVLLLYRHSCSSLSSSIFDAQK